MMIDNHISIYFFKRNGIILFFLLLSFVSNGQSQKEALEIEKRKIEEEINYTNRLLKSATANKTNSLQELILINNRIRQRELLISNYTVELKNLERQISNNDKKILALESDLKQAKTEYALLINYVFKNRDSKDRLMYIFAAENFNQAFQRLKYLQYYSEYRKHQAIRIEQIKDSVSVTNQAINKQKQEKQSILKLQQNEVNVLQTEKTQQNGKINILAKQENQFREKIRQKRKEAEQLNRAINDIISEEIKTAAAKAKASGSENLSDIIALTHAELELTNTLIRNKGKLPWPSEHGIVSSTFGEHDHPVLKRIKIKNNGIDIMTNVGENARAVFDGRVISVRTITNTNKAIIIRHGEFFTVYSNLIDVYVKPGDEVNTRQSLGVVYTNESESKTELHFEIWKGKTLLNPQSWIVK
ncbi:MAG: peptidoglycan DD-metalloendopeptidase family protein [Bacteroidetes bacterium]|nr:peptidoglycan DD-metalloendopeptidase family protein [Bacteroidota bacterium]